MIGGVSMIDISELIFIAVQWGFGLAGIAFVTGYALSVIWDLIRKLF